VNSHKPEVHQTLEKWFGNLEYNNVRGVVEPVFGKDFEYDTEIVGSKWIVVEDCDFGDVESYINFCSAWHPADGFLEELNSVLQAIDENACISFTGDEESDDFLFAGYGSKNGFTMEWTDDVPERPWEEECEEEGIDYDKAIDTFYDDVNEIQSNLLAEAVMEVDKVLVERYK
jgi:hypothetical protein